MFTIICYIEQGIELMYMGELLEERKRNCYNMKFDPPITDHISISELYLEYVSLFY